MKKHILTFMAALLALNVLSGCQSARGPREEYRYYDETVNLLWQGDKRNEEFEKQCTGYEVLTYRADGRVTEINTYWHLNDFDPKDDTHHRILQIYEGNRHKATRRYEYLYDGTLWKQDLTEIDERGRNSRYTEYSTEGRDTVLSYEEFEYGDDGEMSRSCFYDGDGTLLSSQQWYQQENGYRVWVVTDYNKDGSIHYQRTEIRDPNGDGYPVSVEEIGDPDWEGEDEVINIERFMAADFTMEYFRFGEGEKTFVILPGLSVSSVMPSAQAIVDEYAVFKEDFTTYVFDRRSMVPESYSVYQMAEDTASVMLQMGLKDVCLFGASQGGMMALVIAIEHPELVSKLIIGSSAARVDEAGMGVLNEWIKLAKAGQGEQLGLDFGQRLYPPEVFEFYRQVLADMGKAVSQPELDKFAILARGTEGFDVLDRLPEIECPFLAIGSADDAVLGADALKQIVSKMEGKQNFSWYEYDGYGHAAFDMAPDYRQRLFDFFSE